VNDIARDGPIAELEAIGVGSGLLLAGYAVVLVLAGAIVIQTRDVTDWLPRKGLVVGHRNGVPSLRRVA
jgi:hypothetical protein